MSEAVIAAIAGVTSALIAGISAVKANRAEKNSRPVSNGFAGRVTASLGHIEAHLDDVHSDVREVRQALIDHIQNHK